MLMQKILWVIGGAAYVAVMIVVTRFVTRRLRRWLPRMREDIVYSVVLILTAVNYVVWARASSDPRDLTIEIAGAAAFSAMALAGLRWPAVLAAGWLLHGVWDWSLHPMPETTWVPVWFPDLCVGFDFVLAAWIVVRERRGLAVR
jgi:hypothetical protein